MKLKVLVQVELEIMLPEDMSVKESHDIALMLQHKVHEHSIQHPMCYHPPVSAFLPTSCECFGYPVPVWVLAKTCACFACTGSFVAFH